VKTIKKTDNKPSTSGYGAFVNNNDTTTTRCKQKGFWQYDLTKYVTFGTNSNLTLDKKSTKTLIKELLKNKNSQKLFIEPYLKNTLKLNNYSKIRFHGCQAVRHDDHIHLQI